MEILVLTLLLQLLLFFFQLLTASKFSSFDDCPTTCGGKVKVMYPFGIGAGCFLPGFELQCSNNILYIPGLWKIRVLEIMEGELRADSSPYMAVHCPSVPSIQQNSMTINLDKDSPYTFSPQTKFIGVGWNTQAIIKGQESGKGNQCYSETDETNSIINSTCTGKGCCEVSLPSANKHIMYLVKQYVWQEMYPCSYAFVADEWKVNLTISTRPLKRRDEWNITMKLEWAIGESNCKQAMHSEGYACGGNSTCIDSNRGSGYLCKCLDGYKGNPYLNGSQGCQDVDECTESLYNLCAPGESCKNKIPGYTCQCPLGSLGNGLRGQGCNKRLQVILASVAIMMVLGTTLLCFIWCYHAWKKKNLRAMYFRQNGGLLLNQYFSGSPVNETKIFSATELKKATNNYNSKRILGSGGNGTVYKGILNDGTVVAVKKSQKVDQSHVDQFVNELLILARLNHKNIVKLLGCCLESEVPLLVYEFIPNGTLYQILNECMNGSCSMPWKDRIRIANEIAEALSYLHNHEIMTVVHRDVKSSNILLDDNHTVKLADFGISRLVALNKAQVSTAVRGTIGYLDPEYFRTGVLTEKSDVYSYGVVLLELLTSLKPVKHELVQECSSLVIHFMSYARENNIMGIFEEATQKEVQLEELQALAEIAKSCLTMKAEERPTMKKVAEELASLTCRTLSISITPD